ncbi:hypothetical protein THRCLA_05838 [Thraustotheca clavata]|uniref:Uncharacterized protein n=1 Tax=Thraustotheca clavata TaxID=74557 RepID=A0A1V9ZSA7_9STRA|nr:hypothetical protein THRCLA_05838 [Thraustotheca clavata]
MVQSNATMWTLVGSVDLTVHLGLFSVSLSGLELEKMMILEGMHGLRDLVIVNMDLSSSTEELVLATIDTCLGNPSSTALVPVGKLCLNVLYHDDIHNATALVTRADPSDSQCISYGAKGYNYLSLHGNIVSVNPLVTSAMITKYLSGISASVIVTSCSPNATSIPLYNPALSNLTLESSLPRNPEPLISELNFDSMSVNPVGEDQVLLKTKVRATTNSPLGPHSSLALSNMSLVVDLMDDKGVNLGKFTSTEVDVHDVLRGHTQLHLDCDASVDLTNKGQSFGAFVKQLLSQTKTNMGISGAYNVVAKGALGTLHLNDIPLVLTTTMLGMNGLNNVTIQNFTLPGTHTSAGELFQASSSIWNPSIVNMSVGDVGMGLSTASENFGLVSGYIKLTHGPNLLSLDGNLIPKLDAHGKMSSSINKFFSNYLSYSDSNVSIELLNVHTPVPWLKVALQGFKLQTTFPGVDKSFKLIQALATPKMTVHFDAKAMQMQAKLLAIVGMPSALRLPINITQVAISGSLVFNNLTIGHITIPEQSVQYTELLPGAGHLEIDMKSPVIIKIPPTQESLMASFIKQTMFATDVVYLDIASTSANDGAFPQVKTAMGTMDLSNIPLQGSMAIQGMDGLQKTPVRILSIDITHGLLIKGYIADIVIGTEVELYLTMKIEMKNPSQLATSLGDLLVNISVDGYGALGYAHLFNVTLLCCNESSLVEGQFTLRPESSILADRFLSNFVSGYYSGGNAQNITIHGSKDSSDIKILQPALTQLKLSASVPSLPDLFPKTPSLVASSLMYPPSLFHLLTIATALVLRNPFGHAINVSTVDFELFPCKTQSTHEGILICEKYYDTSLARFHPHDFVPMIIPAKNTDGCLSCCQGNDCAKTSSVPLCPGVVPGTCMHAEVTSILNPAIISALFKTMTTGLLMKVNGTLNAMIDEYAMNMHYAQNGLLVTMSK